VSPVTTDRYGRTVGLVYTDGKCLNEQLIKSGFAWLYKQYCNQSMCSDWQRLEQAARDGKPGLWSMPSPVPPWEYRHPNSSSSLRQNKKDIAPSAEVYHGNVGTKVFHQAGCQQYNCKNCTAVFKTRDEAISAGYRPCGRCRP